MKNNVDCYVGGAPVPGAPTVFRNSPLQARAQRAAPPAKRLTLMDSIRCQGRLRWFKTATLGQDLIEYALLAGFVAVAAGAIFPTSLMPTISGIFSQLGSYFAIAANGS
jgi:Flp pilus assembly pilin Flp